MPAETVDRRRPRLVFAPDPATITNSVEMPEQKGIVDLAGPRLVAAGVIGELHMGDAGQMLLQRSRDRLTGRQELLDQVQLHRDPEVADLDRVDVGTVPSSRLTRRDPNEGTSRVVRLAACFGHS